MNLTSKLLIAPPNVRGNFWSKTVIFVTEHSSRGSIGIVINKRSKILLCEFADQIGVSTDVPGYIYVGGPTNSKALTMLHSSEWSCGNTLRINNEFSISSAGDLLERITVGDCPNSWRMFIGLSHWAPGQLELELNGTSPYNHDYSWLIASPKYNLIFGVDEQDQWTQAIEQSGVEFSQKVLA